MLQDLQTSTETWLEASGFQVTKGKSIYPSSPKVETELDRLRRLDSSLMRLSVPSAGPGEYRAEKLNRKGTATYAYRVWEPPEGSIHKAKSRSLGKVGSIEDRRFQLSLKKRDLTREVEKARALLKQSSAIADRIEALMPEECGEGAA